MQKGKDKGPVKMSRDALEAKMEKMCSVLRDLSRTD